jgi:nucleoside-diphosphate-sugar epimerase
MKVFMIGGTGLLGSEAARELIARGHEVLSIALPPLPEGAVLPPEMKIEYGNYLEMTDEEIEKYMTGCEGFVFAAGVDERVEGPAPIYDLYKKYNIDPINRLLAIAKRVGVKHVAICGSYFAYFAKTRKELDLTKHHPYIRSRIDQENAAMSFADDSFDVAVLELPYIFGTQPGRKPVWMFLAEQIEGSKNSILYPKGGSTMVTVKQVGQAIAGAIELNKGGNCYPIGYYNKTWVELLGIASKALGYPYKKVTTIPDFLYKLGGAQLMKEQKKNNIQGGLNMVKFAALQCSNLFIDKEEGAEKLGVQPDDIEGAIADSMKLCKDIMDKKVNSISMRGE